MNPSTTKIGVHNMTHFINSYEVIVFEGSVLKDDILPKVIQKMGLRIALLSDTQLALLLGKEYTKPRWRSSIESLYHVVLGSQEETKMTMLIFTCPQSLTLFSGSGGIIKIDSYCVLGSINTQGCSVSKTAPIPVHNCQEIRTEWFTNKGWFG